MSEHEIYLEKKFPDMKPIGKAPGMGTLNGFGFTLFGNRDHDEETCTYVKTYGLCALFIPIFALSAYRVADAEEGWYFVGKVPLSTLSKAWNCCLVSGIGLAIALVMWNSHISSPEYVAGKKIEQADQLATEGDVAKASKLYYEVATGSTDHREQAAKQLSAMLSGPVQEASAEEANTVFVIACKLQRRDDDFRDVNFRDVVQPYQPAVKLASRLAKSDASGALQLLDTVALLAKDPNSLDEQRLPLLQRLVAQQPDDPNLAGALAAIHESRGKDKKCIDLLTPHRDRLGTTEGARVLGQIFARQGKYEESYALLLPYCEVRLDKLHAAEKSYERLYEQISSRIFKKLNDGKAPDSFYKKYEKAGKVKQNEMVGEYVQSRMKGNEKLLSARENFTPRWTSCRWHSIWALSSCNEDSG
jgi:hypothetical protein